MKTPFKIAIVILVLIAVAAVTTYYMTTHSVPVLHPKGEIAHKEKDLLTTATLLMLIVVIPVIVLTMVFAWRYREGNDKAKYTPEWGHNTFAELLWWGVPFIIIVVLSIITYTSTHELNPFKPLKSKTKPLEVQVVALQWKWLFIYPEQGIATVNYLEIPEKTPINFEITADAPMNSFWIPQLGGQIYAMPAMRTQLHLIANEKGMFRGSSSNFSGKGFAGMKFPVKATSKKEFDQWITQVKSSSNQLGVEEYKELVKQSEYNPATFYQLTKVGLFDDIIEQYQKPDAVLGHKESK